MDPVVVNADVRELVRRSRPIALVAGILFIGWAVVLAVWPGPTIKVLAALVGILFVIGGLAEVVAAVSNRRVTGSHWPWLAAKGVCDVALGVVAIFWPEITILVIEILIGIELILSGIFAIVLSRRAPHGVEERHHYLWRGLLAIAVGLVVLAWPDATVRVFLLLVAFWSLMAGLLSLFAWYEMGRIPPEPAPQ